ncbi:hypothetical protein O3P69_008593 [Scylla paramamosain]|uniref:CAP-Gly domain-containing protein n=1 Tax=Scylla paramamosain TaxID=85552 RepID=A0AAW0SLV5_SCYPA
MCRVAHCCTGSSGSWSALLARISGSLVNTTSSAGQGKVVTQRYTSHCCDETVCCTLSDSCNTPPAAMEGGRRKLHTTAGKGGSDECALSVGDKVVWLSDDYPEFGMVGVEFDNPVGNDNHKVNGRLLFEAEPGHASVLPVNNLMKAEDLLGKESLTPEHGGRPAPPKAPHPRHHQE